MPDLLSHVLVGYAVFRLAGLRYRWLTTPYVTVGMVGALLPDVSKAGLLVPNYRMELLLGVPFDWFAIHTLGGVVLLSAVGTVWVSPVHRRRVFALLLCGAATHLLLDGLLLKPTGHSYAALWPLTRYRLPTPGLYRSTDVWPTLLSLAVAGVAWVAWRRRGAGSGDDGTPAASEESLGGDDSDKA